MEKGEHFPDSPGRHHRDVLELLDLNWFAGNVLCRSESAVAEPTYPSLSAPPPPPPPPQERFQPLTPDVSLLPQPLRSVRHNSLPKSLVLVPLLPESQTPFSPDSVLQTGKLETILSGKTYEDEEGEGAAIRIPIVESPPRRRRAKRSARARRASRSLSELEFEEVKGFMDLGFTFPSDEVSPTLAKIVPGLQRRGTAPDSGGVDVAGKLEEVGEEEEEGRRRRRPYLSEAWDFYDRRKYPLEGWKLPGDADGIEMKERLRTWAHRVASAVR